MIMQHPPSTIKEETALTICPMWEKKREWGATGWNVQPWKSASESQLSGTEAGFFSQVDLTLELSNQYRQLEKYLIKKIVHQWTSMMLRFDYWKQFTNNCSQVMTGSGLIVVAYRSSSMVKPFSTLIRLNFQHEAQWLFRSPQRSDLVHYHEDGVLHFQCSLPMSWTHLLGCTSGHYLSTCHYSTG